MGLSPALTPPRTTALPGKPYARAGVLRADAAASAAPDLRALRAEFELRLSAFTANLRTAAELSALDRGTATYGASPFADMTLEEFASSRLLKPIKARSAVASSPASTRSSAPAACPPAPMPATDDVAPSSATLYPLLQLKDDDLAKSCLENGAISPPPPTVVSADVQSSVPSPPAPRRSLTRGSARLLLGRRRARRRRRSTGARRAS